MNYVKVIHAAREVGLPHPRLADAHETGLIDGYRQGRNLFVDLEGCRVFAEEHYDTYQRKYDSRLYYPNRNLIVGVLNRIMGERFSSLTWSFQERFDLYGFEFSVKSSAGSFSTSVEVPERKLTYDDGLQVALGAYKRVMGDVMKAVG